MVEISQIVGYAADYSPMIAKLMVLCGLVLLSIGASHQIAATSNLVVDAAPTQVLLLGVMMLLFAAAVGQLESQYDI